MNCDCTNPNPFPTSPSLSLTRYVEIFILNTLCNKGKRNQIELFHFNTNTILRTLIYKMNILPSNYIPYIMTNITNSEIKINQINYIDPILRNSTYFIIDKNLDCIDTTRLYGVYHTHSGCNKLGSAQFPEIENRYRLVLPSRGVVFR